MLAGLLVLLIAAPIPGWSAPAASLGTARGVRGVELSLDGGKTWLPLGSRSLPVLEGTQIRTKTGGALVDLADGSRLNLLPFSSASFRETGPAIEISLVYGRLGFRLPPATRADIRSTSARLVPVRAQAMAGEVFVGGDGTVGLRMTQGSLQVEELSGARRTVLASLEPVFLPKRPVDSGPLFASEAAVAIPPAGAKGVFNPGGESLGYLQGNQLVIHPGFTADLTRPFPARLVLVAMAKVPETSRGDATPLFDVNGGYLGYLVGPEFHVPAQIAQAQLVQGGGGAGTGGAGGESQTFLIGGGAGLLLLGGGGIAVGVTQGGGGSSRTCIRGSGQPAATPFGPCR
jgi:hypothetical protein